MLNNLKNKLKKKKGGDKMQLVNIGFGNIVSAERIVGTN